MKITTEESQIEENQGMKNMEYKGPVINYKAVGPGYFSKNPKKFRDPTKLPKKIS